MASARRRVVDARGADAAAGRYCRSQGVTNLLAVAPHSPAVICSAFSAVCDIADGALELRRGRVIRSGVFDAARANPLVDAAFRF
jgi:hypothetical protein